MIKNIILDMGNVLLTYDPEVCLNRFLADEAERAVIRRELFEGPEWLEGDLGYLNDEGRYLSVKERVPEKLHEALRNCTYEWDMCMKPVPGAREFCDRAREKGYRLYVLSNASDSFYRYFPREWPLDYFNGIVVSCDLHIVKPDERIYTYLTKTYGLLPEECFFIDDRGENVEAARRMGMSGAVFRGNYEEMLMSQKLKL